MLPHPTNSSASKGSGFVRLALALASARGDHMQALQFAKEWCGGAEDDLVRTLKSAVQAGTTSDATWASDLTDHRRLSGEFVEMSRPGSIIGKLQGLRRTPANTRTLLEIAGANAQWVGEGFASPMGQLSLDDFLVGNGKAQTSVIVTDDLVRTWSPASEAALKAAMVKALNTALDRFFIDATLAATPNGPAAITYGAASIPFTGSTTAQATADLKALVQAMIDTGSDLAACAWVMHPRSALALSLMLTAGGNYAFPLITSRGGQLLGLPVVTSASVPIDTGNDTYIALIDASRILVADDGLAAVDVSRQSSVQLLTDPTTGAAQLVSLWEHNLVGIRLTRWITWRPVDATAVAVLSDVSY